MHEFGVLPQVLVFILHFPANVWIVRMLPGLPFATTATEYPPEFEVCWHVHTLSSLLHEMLYVAQQLFVPICLKQL